ncbi:MAG: hypothetical protein LDL41_13460 [Coleofasciculus sp. S288]|nr:hypothetical protein [Coleofasciculus sp. S288]
MYGRDLLILTVYLLCVSYVIYKALQSLKDLVTFRADYESINQQLADQNLQDIVEVSFKFKDNYRLDDLKTLKTAIKNKSRDEIVTIDWNQCYIINFNQVAERAIRLISGMKEPPQSQVMTIIRPGQGIDEDISNEAFLDPLINPKELAKAIEPEEGSQFSLRLPIKTTNIEGPTRNGVLRCYFTARKLRWPEALAISMKPKPEG